MLPMKSRLAECKLSGSKFFNRDELLDNDPDSDSNDGEEIDETNSNYNARCTVMPQHTSTIKFSANGLLLHLSCLSLSSSGDS